MSQVPTLPVRLTEDGFPEVLVESFGTMIPRCDCCEGILCEICVDEIDQDVDEVQRLQAPHLLVDLIDSHPQRERTVLHQDLIYTRADCENFLGLVEENVGPGFQARGTTIFFDPPTSRSCDGLFTTGRNRWELDPVLNPFVQLTADPLRGSLALPIDGSYIPSGSSSIWTVDLWHDLDLDEFFGFGIVAGIELRPLRREPPGFLSGDPLGRRAYYSRLCCRPGGGCPRVTNPCGPDGLIELHKRRPFNVADLLGRPPFPMPPLEPDLRFNYDPDFVLEMDIEPIFQSLTPRG